MPVLVDMLVLGRALSDRAFSLGGKQISHAYRNAFSREIPSLGTAIDKSHCCQLTKRFCHVSALGNINNMQNILDSCPRFGSIGEPLSDMFDVQFSIGDGDSKNMSIQTTTSLHG
jgi:hypothetical protein